MASAPPPPPPPAKRTSRGRQKIEIKLVEAKNKRHVTFSKRKLGLFHKAAEFSILTGAQIAVITFSQHGKPFSFGNPSSDAVIQSYLGQHLHLQRDCSQLPAVPCHARNCKQQYIVAMNRLDEEGVTSKHTKEEKDVTVAAGQGISMINSNNGGGFWWERRIVPSTDLEEVNQIKDSLRKLKEMVEKRAPKFSYYSLLVQDKPLDCSLSG